MKIWLAAALALAMSGAARAQDAAAPQTPLMPIYSDRLADGWDNWSWADVQISLEVPNLDERPIAVRADGWEALYLHHAPFSTQGYSALVFYVHGLQRGGQPIQIQAVDERGEALPNRGPRTTAAAGEWTEVRVSLADLGAENRTVSGFWIQNGSGETISRFLVAEISLQ